MKKRIMVKNTFLKNVFTLMSGATIAQAIPILISPILTRIYTPSEFGVYSFYLSVVTILSIVATGRYELAIMLPKKEKDALTLVKLSVLINIIITIILFLLISLLKDVLFENKNLNMLGWVIYLIPLSVFLFGLYNSVYYWSSRNQLFKVISTNRVIQSFSLGGSQLLLGIFKNTFIGLILGQFFSQLISLIRLLKKSNIQIEFKKNKNNNMKELAFRYINFPKYTVASHSIESVASNMPQLLLTTFFGSISTGYYALMMRMIGLPLGLIGKAVGDVFLQKASSTYAVQGECKNLFLKIFRNMAIIAIIPFILLYIFSVPIFELVFGAEWKIAGEYARLLIIPLYLQFIANPLSHMFVIAEKVKLELLIQVILVILSFSSLYIGFIVYSSVYISLMLYSLVLTLKYIFFIIICYYFAKGKNI